jgi:hypothetical protein
MSMNPLDFLAHLLLRWRAKESKPLLERAERLEREVSALSLDEAKRRALELVDGGRYFRAVKRSLTSEEESSLRPLPRELALLLRVFATIAMIRGDQRIGRDHLGPSEQREGFLRIGLDMNFAEVAVRAGDEAIYVLAPGEEPALEAPSIHHWLILLARLSEGPT